MKQEFINTPLGLTGALSTAAGTNDRYAMLSDEQRAMMVAKAVGMNSKREIQALLQELSSGAFPQ